MNHRERDSLATRTSFVRSKEMAEHALSQRRLRLHLIGHERIRRAGDAWHTAFTYEVRRNTPILKAREIAENAAQASIHPLIWWAVGKLLLTHFWNWWKANDEAVAASFGVPSTINRHVARSGAGGSV